jgi:hypothetical protein
MKAASGTWCGSLGRLRQHLVRPIASAVKILRVPSGTSACREMCFTDVPSYSPAASPKPPQGLPARDLILRCPQTGDASKRASTLFGDGHDPRINPDHHIGPLLHRCLADVAT